MTDRYEQSPPVTLADAMMAGRLTLGLVRSGHIGLPLT